MVAGSIENASVPYVYNDASYSYKSFYELANAIAISRVYGGINTPHAVEEGTKQGIRTAENIDRRVKFLKE